MDYVKAFVVGGIICAIVQILMEKTKLMPGRIMVMLVCTGALLGAVGIYGPFSKWAGAGANVPLLGFGNVLWKGVQIFDIVIKCRADLGVVLLNAVPDQAQVSNDPCIFVLIHFGIMLPIQLPPVKNLLGHADQIADFGNDPICTVWIVDFFLNGFFCLLLGRIRLLCAGFVDLFEFFNGHCHL